LLGEAFVQSVWPEVQLALAGKASQFERVVTMPGGGTGHIMLQYVPRYEEGKVTGFYALVTNITELRIAQLEKATEERNKEAVINASQDQIWSVDRDCRLTTANNAFLATLAKVTGRPLCKGEDMRTVPGLPPGMASHWGSLYAKALAGDAFSEELYYDANDWHGPIWMEYTFSPIIQNDLVIGAACNGRDITPRKNAETALFEANQQLSLVLNTVTDVIYVLRPGPGDRFRLQLTNRVLDVHTVTREQASGRYIDEFMPRERLVVLEQKIAEAISSRTTVQWEQEFVSGDKLQVGVQTITPVFNESGACTQIIGSISDITAIRQAEQVRLAMAAAERFTQERLNTSLREVADYKYALDKACIVAITDTRGTITYVNEKFCTISGYLPEELIGQNHRILNSGYHPKEMFRALWRSIGSGQVWHGEIRNKTKEGAYYWVDTTIVPFLNSAGKPYQYVAIRSDITRKKMAEMELSASELKFRSMVEHINDVIVLVDKDGCILFASPSLTTVAGYKPGDIMGKKAMPMVHPTDYERVKKKLALAVAGGIDKRVFELQYRHKDGHFVTLEAQANNQLANPSVAAIVITCRDITQRKIQEQEKNRLISELTQSNTDLKQFSYITSHNLRAPLTNLLAIFNLLNEAQPLAAERASLLKSLESSTLQLNDTLNDLMRILLIRDRKGVHIEDVHFAGAYKAGRRMIELLLKEAGALITTNFDEAPAVPFVQPYMESIFLNLLSNAIKYRDPGRPLQIEIASRNAPENVILTVKDNGIGMHLPAVKNKVFGMYQRFHKQSEGKGLGLYLVYTKMKSLGGDVAVDSKEGEGTIFTLSFKRSIDGDIAG